MDDVGRRCHPRAHYNMQETRHTSTLETRPQARAGTITGWSGSAAAWHAVPIQGAGVLTTARPCGIGTASGIDGDGPLAASMPEVRVRLKEVLESIGDRPPGRR